MTRPIDRALGAAAALLVLVGCAAVSAGPAEPETTTAGKVSVKHAATAVADAGVAVSGPRPEAASPASPAWGTAPVPGPADAPSAARDADAAVAAELTVLLGALRAEHGLPPLAPDTRLEASAAAQVRSMMQRGRLFHQELDDELDVGWTLVGENVGYGPDAATIHRALVDSPRHFANLVDHRFSHVGVVVDTGPDGRLWVAQLFGG